jgi:hypothetical protein
MSRSLDVGLEVDRSRRADRGIVRLTERDVASLHWIGEQYAVRIDQLARLLGRPTAPVSDSTARGVVSRWVRAGLAESKKLIAGEPGFVWLSRRGLRQVDLAYKPWEPSVGILNHVYWVNQVRLSVEARHAGAKWIPERELRQGAAMQTFDGKVHVADGELRLDRGTVAIEVELTAKSVPRRKTIISELASRYVTVWYFAPPDVARLLESVRLQIAGSDRIRIYSLERVQ